MTPHTMQMTAMGRLNVLLSHAEAADRILSHRWRPLLFPTQSSLFTSRDHARAWLADNSVLVTAAVTDAHRARHYEAAWRLCAALHTQLEAAADPLRWISVLEVGFDAAHRCGGLPSALMSSMLGRCLMHTGDLPRADDMLSGAEHRWQHLRQPRGQADTTRALGDVALLGGDAGLAEARYRRALELYARLGDERGIWRIRYLLGQTYLAQGRYGRAAQYLEDARSWYADHGDQPRALAAAVALEHAHRSQGRPDRTLRTRASTYTGTVAD